MTRAEALKLNKRYQLSDEVKEILKENGHNCQIWVDCLWGTPRCYMMRIFCYYEKITFSEARKSDNVFDNYARKLLCTVL